MSAPTIAEQGYELRESTTRSGALRIEACIPDEYHRDGVVGIAAALGVETRTGPVWLIVARPTTAANFEMPGSTLKAESRDGAVEWLQHLATLHIKAAAA